MLVVGDLGITQILAELRVNWNAVALTVHLFKNNFTPTNAAVLANFTESTFAGYVLQNIVTWGAPSLAAHIATIVAAANVFTRSSSGAGEAVYGYYVTLADNATYLWGERDPLADTVGPVTLYSAGDSYTAVCKLNCRDLNT